MKRNNWALYTVNAASIEINNWDLHQQRLDDIWWFV